MYLCVSLARAFAFAVSVNAIALHSYNLSNSPLITEVVVYAS